MVSIAVDTVGKVVVTNGIVVVEVGTVETVDTAAGLGPVFERFPVGPSMRNLGDSSNPDYMCWHTDCSALAFGSTQPALELLHNA